MLEAKETIVKASSKNLDKLKSQAENLDDLLEQGLYTKEKYIERANKLNGRIKEAESALTAATTELNLEKQRLQAKSEIIPKVEHVLDVYPCTDDVMMQNELLKSVIEVCTYVKTVRGHWSRPETLESFEVRIYPRLGKNI
ncbi:hypothetical protein D3C87_1593200 [compost metagenome]